MKRRFNCMFMLPPELTGLSCDKCMVFQSVCLHDEMCVGRQKHTEESRQALAKAIEVRGAEREKDSPLTPPVVS